MRKRNARMVLSLVFGILAFGAAAFAQFLPEELAERAKWEALYKDLPPVKFEGTPGRNVP